MTRNISATSPWLTGVTRGWNWWMNAVAPPVDPAPAWIGSKPRADRRAARDRRVGAAQSQAATK